MLKLGRIPSKHDERTLRFAKYADVDRLPASPMARDWIHPEHAPAWGMFRNGGSNALGNCTAASHAHALQSSAANNDRPLTITDAEVIDLYSRSSGYDPAKPETDQGAEMLDVLKQMRSTGLGGHRIGAYAKVDPLSRRQTETAINSLGWLYVGVDLPLAAKNQTVWDIATTGVETADYKPNSWGPHAMAMLGYDYSHAFFVTWGRVRVATRRWFARYCSEAWAVFDASWIDDTSKLSPSGFDLSALMRDLVEISRA